MQDVDAADRLTTAVAAQLRRAWIALVVRLRAANPPAQLQHRLHVIGELQGTEQATAALATTYRSQLVAAGSAVSRDITRQLNTQVAKDVSGDPVIDFDPVAPNVLTWAERNRLDLIRGITAEQRILIRFALSRAQEEGENPLVTAREIQESIGLTETQLGWVANFRRSLESGDLIAAAQRELVDGRTTRTLTSTAARSAKLSPEQIDAAVTRYRDAMIRYRAETIARTEAARIVGAGTTDAYEQSIAAGHLQAAQIECTWVHSPRARGRTDRDFHVEMHGQRRPWGVPFTSGLGNSLLYPCDPEAPVKETANCRCARTVRVRVAMRRAA